MTGKVRITISITTGGPRNGFSMIWPRPHRFRAFRFSLAAGSVSCPKRFRVLYRQDGAWKEATGVKGGFILPDGGWTGKWSQITFAPVQADAVKLELSLCGADRSQVALANVREQIGFTPWYFNLPDPQFAVAWKQVMDPQGFFAPLGLTTLEQRAMKHPLGQVKQRTPKSFYSYAGPSCTWSGPSWPYSTSITLTGLANLLNGLVAGCHRRKRLFQAAGNLCESTAPHTR